MANNTDNHKPLYIIDVIGHRLSVASSNMWSYSTGEGRCWRGAGHKHGGGFRAECGAARRARGVRLMQSDSELPHVRPNPSQDYADCTDARPDLSCVPCAGITAPSPKKAWCVETSCSAVVARFVPQRLFRQLTLARAGMFRHGRALATWHGPPAMCRVRGGICNRATTWMMGLVMRSCTLYIHMFGG